MAKDFALLQRQFAQSIRYPNASTEGELNTVEERRLNIYRELFFNNVEGFISGTFPVLKSLFNDDAWQQLVRFFFQKHSAETPYFLEISEEFLAFLQANMDALVEQGMQVPEYALELAHWEWMELLADRAETQQGDALPIKRISVDACYTIQDAAWGGSYQYPVHKAAAGVDIQPGLTCLLIYRDAQDLVGFVEVNPLSFMLFERLQSNSDASLNSILNDIAQESGLDPNQVRSGGMQVIEQWRDLAILRAISA